jgi:hypothetical protein
MNDNLTIHIDDFLKNPSISENSKFTRDEVLSALQSSSKFSFDSLNETISPNYKAKRRIIVFRDIPKENQNEDQIKSLFSLCFNNSKDLNIVKISSVSEMFYVYFATEDETLLAFKQIEKLRESADKVNYIST